MHLFHKKVALKIIESFKNISGRSRFWYIPVVCYYTEN